LYSLQPAGCAGRRRDFVGHVLFGKQFRPEGFVESDQFQLGTGEVRRVLISNPAVLIECGESISCGISGLARRRPAGRAVRRGCRRFGGLVCIPASPRSAECVRGPFGQADAGRSRPFRRLARGW
jgi:hypothetical protein